MMSPIPIIDSRKEENILLKNKVWNWYKQIPIKFEIIKSLYNREFAVINRTSSEKTMRTLKCHNIVHYDFLMDKIIRMEENNDLCNFYFSLARYKNGIPNQDFSKGVFARDNSEWTKNHWKEMAQFDFLLDIDVDKHENIEYGCESTSEIKEYFDDLKVPYSLRFSGCGFHFIIKGEQMPQLSFNPKEQNNIYQLHSLIAQFMHREFCDLVDFRIYDSRRLCKLPFSLSCYPKENKAYMCFVFHSDEQFKQFNSDDMDNLRFIDIKNLNAKIFAFQGDYVFNSNGNCDKLLGACGVEIDTNN